MRPQTDQPGTLAVANSRLADYLVLANPELTLLSVLTSVCGAYLASGATLVPTTILHTFIGTLLVGSGAGTLNQFIEREYDRLMRRTANRPLPSGRLRPSEALALGAIISAAGVADLALFTNVLAGGLAFVTLVTYLFLYTPLKRLTPMATIVGAIPGALPPLIGWVAVSGELSFQAFSLFLVLFFWQMPHFLSLAWMYRVDYARAGYRTLPVLDQGGRRTSRHILAHSIALVGASLLPFLSGSLGPAYAVVALGLGGFLVGTGLNLAQSKTNAAARSLFVASLIYLPCLLVSMVATKL